MRFDEILKAHATTATNDCYAKWCENCNEYRSPSCLSLCFEHKRRDRDNDATTMHKSPLTRCENHLWFSRHELTLYYQTFVDLREPNPLMHEIACHGFLSISCFPLSTDISKIIVSINAHRRSLNVVPFSTSHSDDSWSRYGNTNGKFARMIYHDSVSSLKERRLMPKNAIKLLFAFGDVDMLNCEDGYVLNDRMPLLTETLLKKKKSLSYANLVPWSISFQS